MWVGGSGREVEEATPIRAVVGGVGEGGDELREGERMTAETGEGVRVIL